ncbi:MAG: heme o synthase [Bacteroidota bacterium]
MENTLPASETLGLKHKIRDYSQLTKMRLATLVVFSAAMAFMTAPGAIDFVKMGWLVLGGFLVTGSANGFNQVMERELDILMDRTKARPLPDVRMSISEAITVCIISGIIGVAILGYFMNLASAILGVFAIVLYTIAYTPMKRKSPIAVFIGAVPGAIPPLLGYVAATGNFNSAAWLLFGIQFLWQFPHFWAIAWVMDDDYKKAGFNLLPTGKRDKGSAWQTVLYTISLVPVAVMPWVFGVSGWISMVVMLAVTLYFLFQAIQLYRMCSIEAARKLMYGSFFYLPVVQIAMVIDKIG